MKTRLVNVDIDLDEEREKVKQEQVDLAVDAQEARRDTFIALRDAGLPIPEDLRNDFQPVAQTMGVTDAKGDAESQVLPSLGLDQPAPTDALAPTDEDIAASEEEDDTASFGGEPLSDKKQPEDGGDDEGSVIPLPKNKHPQVPPESHEQAKDMPKASRLERGPLHVGARRNVHLDRRIPLDEQLGTVFPALPTP